MISKIFRKIIGTRNDRILKGFTKNVAAINALEPTIQALSDEQLRAKTTEFKQRLKEGATLDSLLVEAFAVVREASRRTLGLRHFDVQLIGGMALHNGKIAEMRTGEGKTLVATLPTYLNALHEESVHVITVNDYLAKRDATWMMPIFEFLGMTVGINLTGLDAVQKKAAYAADVTYGTNNEFGFDYLRDNMVFSLNDRVQRTLKYAIVDEVDSILIDEARTPLIISGQAEDSSEQYIRINKLIPLLTEQKMKEGQKEEEVPEAERADYYLDEKNRQVHLTELGHQHIEELLAKDGVLQAGTSLYDISNIALMHYVSAALRAHTLYHRDVEYVVKNGEVIIVDEHTGRLMAGRRWSDGLHQAVEAKEGVNIQLENQTLATITFQNYFRLYEKLAGMTGTADTEAYEFQKIYGLEVVVIPTNQPMVRKDKSDQIYLTKKEKFKSILAGIKECQQRQQPVLVGTTSIENSEVLSKWLTDEKIPHEVLNAKYHEREAMIIAQAGRPSAVTIATNMAGRGTDIVLGGSLEAELAELENATEEEVAKRKVDWKERHDTVLKAGGLHVLGTERHESRRIDNQLRGRSGRQGDTGSSQFYLSLEDNLLRIFAAERMANIMRRLGIQEGEVIEHPWITKAIENAQRRVEGLNFDIRKQLLEFDDVVNDQRKVIYQQRHELLKTEDISKSIKNIRESAINTLVERYVPPQSLEEQWDIAGLEQEIQQEFGIKLPISSWLSEDEELHEDTLRERVLKEIQQQYDEKEKRIGGDVLRQIEKNMMVQILDSHWRDHLSAMDLLRQGIYLRGYAQKNPIQEYKRESFGMFTQMLDNIKYELAATLSKVDVKPEEPWAAETLRPAVTEMHYQHAEFGGVLNDNALAQTQSGGDEVALAERDQLSAAQTIARDGAKVGRNDPCPCGSGKKYKQCHGKIG